MTAMHYAYGEFIEVGANGDSYEAAMAQAILYLKDRLEPDQEVLRRVPKELNKQTWCLVRSNSMLSPGGSLVRVEVVFEYVHPDDLEDS